MNSSLNIERGSVPLVVLVINNVICSRIRLSQCVERRDQGV